MYKCETSMCNFWYLFILKLISIADILYYPYSCLQSSNSRWAQGGFNKQWQRSRRGRNEPYSVLGLPCRFSGPLSRVRGHWTVCTHISTAQWLSTACRQQTVMIKVVNLKRQCRSTGKQYEGKSATADSFFKRTQFVTKMCWKRTHHHIN